MTKFGIYLAGYECSCINLPNICNMAEMESSSNIIEIDSSSYGDTVKNPPKIMPPAIFFKARQIHLMFSFLWISAAVIKKK